MGGRNRLTGASTTCYTSSKANSSGRTQQGRGESRPLLHPCWEQAPDEASNSKKPKSDPKLLQPLPGRRASGRHQALSSTRSSPLVPELCVPGPRRQRPLGGHHAEPDAALGRRCAGTGAPGSFEDLAPAAIATCWKCRALSPAPSSRLPLRPAGRNGAFGALAPAFLLIPRSWGDAECWRREGRGWRKLFLLRRGSGARRCCRREGRTDPIYKHPGST